MPTLLPPLLRKFTLCLGVFLMLCGTGLLKAQILVDLSIKRNLYIAYEPLLATVRITNLSGNRLLLADVEGKKWFGFQIETLDGRPIPPSDPNYEIAPLQIEPGATVTRTVNLTQLYPLSDFGSYRVRATVYSTELNGYFSSPPLTIEITEGRLIWQQVVGVPGVESGAGSSRTITLLSHRLPERTDLYLRIEDKSVGLVYCTHRLGDFISYGKPDVQLDAFNTIHILQNAAPHLFIYSKVGLDGKILERTSFQAAKERPQLKRSSDGAVVVMGGVPFDPHAAPTPATIPKLSDRPPIAPLPTPTPEEKTKGKPLPPAKKPAKPAKPTPTPRPTPTPLKID